MTRDDEFVRETRTSLRRLTNGLLELERNGTDREQLDDLFRTAHTLKGNCDMAGLDGASRLAHAVEDFLSSLRDGTLTPNPDLVDSSLAAIDDMDSMLDEWHERGTVTTDPESAVTRLREEMRRYETESGPQHGAGSQSGSDAAASDGEHGGDTALTEAAEEFDPTVVDALESASDFDDLDRLMAEMDDPEEGDDDGSRGWGTFDREDSADASEERSTDADDSPAARSGTTEASEEPPGPTSEFDAIKRDVETDDISDLDDELVDVEFGEFDDDDELSIRDLVEGDLTDADSLGGDGDPSAESTERDAPPESAATEPFSGSEAIRAEDFGFGSADLEPPDAPATPDADEADARSDGTTPGETSAESPADGPGLADPSEPEAGDGDRPSADAGTVEADGAPDESLTASDVFGLADDDATETTEASDHDGDGRGDVDVDFPDDEPFGSGGGGSFESDEEDLPDDSAFEIADTLPDELPDDDPDAGEDVTDELDELDELDEPVESGEPDGLDDVFDRSDERRPESGPDLAGDLPDPSVGGESADVDLSDVDFPDVDTLSGATADEAGGPERVPEVSFARDEHTVEFESRFAERFGDDDEDVVPLVQSASATIEESRLDATRYQSSGTTEYPLDFGDTRQADQIQSITVDVENADTLLNLVDELSLAQLRLRRADEDEDDHLSQIASVTSELRRTVMDLRLMPLSTVVEGLPRVVRDVARRQEKRVTFEVSDEGVDLDRSIVEKLGDPLVHLVRNAVDHGIESPAERERKNKPPEGTVELRAWRDRERVVIEVEDDGRGLSADRIRQQAIDRDVASREQIERMALDEVYDLVFEPGFSTAEEVTDVSGRGVGMDAVKRTVTSLDGTVTIESEPDAGTTVRIRLPVSVAVAKMLFVGVGSEQYAIPADVVDGVEHLDEDALTGDGRVAVEWPDDERERPTHVPLFRPREAFDAGGGCEGGDGDAGRVDDGVGEGVLVRIDPDARELALLCDSVGDAREVVVRPYEKLLGGVPGFSGATMSGDGTLVNIIDVTTL